MRIAKRLKRIEDKIRGPMEIVYRLAGWDGYYPEAEEDAEKGRRVILIQVKGIGYDELITMAK